MAFVISYEEYSHHYTDKRKPFWLSMQAALFAFIFFLALTIIIGFFVTFMA